MNDPNNGPRLRLLALRLAPLLGLVAASAPLACGGDVSVIGASWNGSGGQGGHGTCDPTETPTPPDAAPLKLSNAKSGAFVGDMLHLQATVSGIERYIVLDIDSKADAYLVGSPDALLGPANLAEVAAGTRARVRVEPDGSAYVDVVDTGKPAAPALIATLPLKGVVEAPTVFSATSDRLFFCLRPSAEEAPQLVSVNLKSPADPGAPEVINGAVCGLYESAKFAASGSTWLSWDQPTGTFVQATSAYAVAGSGAQEVADYAYNQTGIHQYGNVIDAATNGLRAVFDPENESEFLLFSHLEGPNAEMAWGYLGIAGPKRLLGVADTLLYLTTADSVRAYDIADIQSPKLLPYEATIAFSDGAPRLLAASDRFLAVADGAGALYLVPRDEPGDVAPLKVYEEVKPPVLKPPPCTH